MTDAGRLEGPCAPLFFSTLALIIIGTPAHSQTVDLSALEICAGLESTELKLTCFEAIIATANPPADKTPEPVAAKSEKAAATGAGSTLIIAADPVQTEATAETASERQSASSKSGFVLMVETPPPDIDSRSVSEEGFGQAQLGKDTDTAQEVLAATVTEVTRNSSRGALYFHLANGQVWRQIEPKYFPHPKEGEFDVEISTGIMGAYRLQVGNRGRKVKIRRVK